MGVNDDNEIMDIKPPLLQAKPLEVYSHYGNMNANLQVLQDHYNNQLDMVKHMTTGQTGGQEADTTIVVPQFNTFNPSGPNDSNLASQSCQLTRLINKQNGWQDSWATVIGEPAVDPPPAPTTMFPSGGRKSKKRKSKMRKSKMRKSKMRKSKMRKSKKKKFNR